MNKMDGFRKLLITACICMTGVTLAASIALDDAFLGAMSIFLAMLSTETAHGNDFEEREDIISTLRSDIEKNARIIEDLECERDSLREDLQRSRPNPGVASYGVFLSGTEQSEDERWIRSQSRVNQMMHMLNEQRRSLFGPRISYGSLF